MKIIVVLLMGILISCSMRVKSQQHIESNTIQDEEKDDIEVKIVKDTATWVDGKLYNFIRINIPVNKNDIVNMRRSNIASFPYINVRIYDQLNYVNVFFTEEPYSYFTPPLDLYDDYTTTYYSVLFHADAFEKFKGKLHCEISAGFSDYYEVKTITFEYVAVTPLDSSLLKLNTPSFNGAKIEKLKKN